MMTTEFWYGVSAGWLAGWFLSVPVWIYISRS